MEEHDEARLELDILLRSRELKMANSRLQEQEASLRTAKRLLKLGIWKLNLDSDVLSWSDDIYDMYDIAPEDFGHCFDAYLQLMHPDDRQGLVDELNSFLEKPDTPLQFRHRIPRFWPTTNWPRPPVCNGLQGRPPTWEAGALTFRQKPCNGQKRRPRFTTSGRNSNPHCRKQSISIHQNIATAFDASLMPARSEVSPSVR